jgi:hypothetical protein
VADEKQPSVGARRQESRSRRSGELLIGRLVGHAAANYQFRAKEDPSYYIRVLTSRGERTLWGKDLQRAIIDGETKPKAGDLIGARRVSREAVTVTTRRQDGEGRVIVQAEHHAHRTRWVVEKVTFFAERARLARRLRDEQLALRESVRTHPELKSTFLTVRAAEEFAAQRIADPKDRERFMELVKGAMVGSIHKGEPLPSVRLKEAAKRPEDARTASKTILKRDDPTR